MSLIKMKGFAIIFGLAFLQPNISCAKDTTRVKNRFAPDFYTVQYAGSIGFGSVGAGYSFFREKVAVSLMYGYLPQSFGGEIHTATLKYVYKPFRIKSGNISWKPINPGLFLSNSFGSGFHFRWPDQQYPKGYYWWSPSLRVHPSLSSEITLATKGRIKGVSFYAEINTNDLYLFSYFANPAWLSPYKIFKSGYGIHLKF